MIPGGGGGIGAMVGLDGNLSIVGWGIGSVSDGPTMVEVPFNAVSSIDWTVVDVTWSEFVKDGGEAGKNLEADIIGGSIGEIIGGRGIDESGLANVDEVTMNDGISSFFISAEATSFTISSSHGISNCFCSCKGVVCAISVSLTFSI